MSKIAKEPQEKWMRILKERRIQQGMTVDEFKVALETHGCTVARKTIYGWESGASRPDVNTFLIMCQILKVSDLRLFVDFSDGTEDATIITDTEAKLLRQYRKTKIMQEAFDKLLDD